MRVIAGEFGGRRLHIPKSADMRPTAGRVREACFNRLGDRVKNARIADLFAGSGAIGLEALSRGARQAVFVEKANPSLRALRGNIEALDVADRSTIRRTDAMRFVRDLGRGDFDIVFADPPYATAHASDLVRLFLDAPFGTILCVEHASSNSIPAGMTHTYGDAALTFVDAT